MNRAVFTDADKVAVTACEDGCVRRWDVESGKLVQCEQVHGSIITDMQVRTQAKRMHRASWLPIVDFESDCSPIGAMHSAANPATHLHV